MLLTFPLCMTTSRIHKKKCYHAVRSGRLGRIKLPQTGYTYPTLSRCVMQQSRFSMSVATYSLR